MDLIETLFPQNKSRFSLLIKKRQFSLHCWQNFSLSIMATLRNRRKLAAVSRETPEKTKNGQSQNTFDPKTAQDYISQVSEEIEGRVIKKLSKEFSRTESRILGALSKLDEFHLNPKVRTCSVAVLGTSRSNKSENREPSEVRSLDDRCPEAVFSSCHISYINDSDQEETHHMVAGVREEIPYCSRGTSSAKQKKARSTSHPQFRSENTLATIEANKNQLAIQQLATNSNSA